MLKVIFFSLFLLLPAWAQTTPSLSITAESRYIFTQPQQDNTFWENYYNFDLSLNKTPNLTLIKKDFNTHELHQSLVGGDSSGGGSFTLNPNNKQLTLLDFSAYTKAFEKSYSIKVSDPPITLKNSAYVLGYQRASIKTFEKMKFYSLVSHRLNIWEKSSPIVIKYLRRSLKNIYWRLTPYNVMSFYENEDIIGGVFYSHDKGAWLSIPVWNKLDDLSRAGLFIHEAFRHLELHDQIGITENNIRLFTAKIMLTHPQKEETLDHSEYFSNKLSTIVYEIVHRDLIISYKNYYELSLSEYLNQDIVKTFPLHLRETLTVLSDFSLIKNVRGDDSKVFLYHAYQLQEYRDNQQHPKEIRESISTILNFLLELRLQLDKIHLQHTIQSMDTASMINTMNQLIDSVNKLPAEAAVQDYLERGIVPFPPEETEKREQFIQLIERLKSTTQKNLANGVLIIPFI